MQIFKAWGQQFEFPPDKLQQVDWSAFYFQHNIKHALRYLSKKWQDGYKIASLIKATLINQDIKLIKLDNKQFGDAKIPGKMKAILAKQQILKSFEIDLGNELLMKRLGEHNKLLEVLDCDEYEVIIPHSLFNQTNFRVQIVSLFKVSETQQFVTNSYKKQQDNEWKNIKGDARYEPYLISQLFES